jgi:hypothetical protein
MPYPRELQPLPPMISDIPAGLRSALCYHLNQKDYHQAAQVLFAHFPHPCNANHPRLPDLRYYRVQNSDTQPTYFMQVFSTFIATRDQEIQRRKEILDDQEKKKNTFMLQLLEVQLNNMIGPNPKDLPLYRHRNPIITPHSSPQRVKTVDFSQKAEGIFSKRNKKTHEPPATSRFRLLSFVLPSLVSQRTEKQQHYGQYKRKSPWWKF